MSRAPELSADVHAAAVRYRDGGAGDVVEQNARRWDHWAIRPRTLTGVRDPRVGTSVLGRPIALPVVVAPSALHGLWHVDAEAATARAARDAGTLLALSQASTLPPEDVVVGPYLQQLYLPEDRSLAAPFVDRARAAGAVGLVLTVDQLPVPAVQSFRADVDLPWPSWSAWDPTAPGAEPAAAFTADDVRRLVETSGLPVLVKGILHPDDALAAVEAGAAGIVVSNHSGRQLPASVTPAEVLGEIADAVGGAVPVHVDSGIRDATDVFRALCLGAETAWVGRPVLRLLESGGPEAVTAWLDRLAAELVSLFALTGVVSPADCHPGLLHERVVR